MIIDITICISLLICIIGFIFVTINYIKFSIYYKKHYNKEQLKKIKQKEKEKDYFYGILR